MFYKILFNHSYPGFVGKRKCVLDARPLAIVTGDDVTHLYPVVSAVTGDVDVWGRGLQRVGHVTVHHDDARSRGDTERRL